MTKVSDAKRRADAAYEARREKVLVRLTQAETELLDIARGDLTRTGYVRCVVRRALGLMPDDHDALRARLSSTRD